jgi:DNA-binding MarR family transcriptional regulator
LPQKPQYQIDFHANHFAATIVGMKSLDSRLDAWRAVVTSHAAVTERVQKALAAADLPPLSWFEVLWAVRRSPTGRPRMSELAEWLTLSRGGITKLVDRLVDAGYMRRVSCSEDRRSLQAELTAAGERMLEEMRAIYAAEVERHLGTLTAAEAKLLTATLEKVTASTCDDAVGQATASAAGA